MAKKYLIANGKGGVAKTTTAVIAAEAFRSTRGNYPVMLDVDQGHKLARFLGAEVVAVEVDNSPEAIAENPDALLQVWDVVGRALRSDDDVLIDLGANLVAPFATWCELSQIGLHVDHELTVIVPFAIEEEAINHAIFALTKLPEIFDPCKLVRVETKALASTKIAELAVDIPNYAEFDAIPGVEKLRVMQFPNLPLWLKLESQSMTYIQAIQVGSVGDGASKAEKREAIAKFAEAFGYADVLEAGRALTALSTWGRSTTVEIAKIL